MKNAKKLAVPVGRMMVMLMAILWPAAVAMAQASSDIKVSDNQQKAWMGYALILFLGGMVLLINLLPSKRSHQD